MAQPAGETLAARQPRQGPVCPPASDDERWMRRALELADRGRRTVSPNPLVGCVLVADGRVVGEGYHERAGGPHAEALALAAAGPHAAGATAYVTLEPCAHDGRTPPCTAALINAAVARVVAALADPHPDAGGGATVLRAAGIDVALGVGADIARRQNEVFLHSVTTGRPYVILKAALSLDGRIAAADSTSRWLTGAAARTRAHELRAEVDALLVGSGTILADDPQLTCRLVDYDGPQPLRVVLDRRGRVDRAKRVFDDSAPTVVLDQPLPESLASLWDRDVRSVLVEGGAAVATAFIAAGLVDKVVAFVAPVLLGGTGQGWLGDVGVGTLTAAPRFRLDAVERLGNDAVLTLYPARSGDGGRPAPVDEHRAVHGIDATHRSDAEEA